MELHRAYARPRFHFLRGQLWRTAHPDTVGGKLVRNVLMMPNAQKGSSGGTVFNLNVDLSDKQGSVVVPIDLVKQAIDKADYIGGMNRCLCRTANKCEHYPADLGCLFLGKSGQAVVKHRIAREFTKERRMRAWTVPPNWGSCACRFGWKSSRSCGG